jgi:hypothetical protein
VNTTYFRSIFPDFRYYKQGGGSFRFFSRLPIEAAPDLDRLHVGAGHADERLRRKPGPIPIRAAVLGTAERQGDRM